ncbi:MAG: phenylacetate--CoA ligase family protein [Granulosicoccus sp.]|nr:phenylacetate--CoA ligase family protein [Granulosicoccus sp.]
MMANGYFDDLECQSSQQREQTLFAGFTERLSKCMEQCPGLREHLAEVDTQGITDRSTLKQLPVLRKAELMKAQQADPPFGGFVPRHALHGARVFVSPGPVWEPQISSPDPWQAARALHAAGIVAGDRVHNAFSYHMTPGGFILDEGARALGCSVLPAGVGNTDMQVAAIRHWQPSVYTGTPDYLQTLLDHASDTGEPLTCFKKALVSGGALFPAMREQYQDAGIRVRQCYATADLGVIAYESESNGILHPGMIVNENLIVEILVPGTASPVSKGEVGEIVVTRLHSDYPLLRFATGDLSAEIIEPSPCGRTGMRLKGWMGRADQRAKVRGMFVDPQQLASLAKAHPQIDRWRLIISRSSNKDVMSLQLTVKESQGDQIPAGQSQHPDQASRLRAVAETLQQVTGLKGDVQVVDALPDDGLVIDDQRDYENS